MCCLPMTNTYKNHQACLDTIWIHGYTTAGYIPHGYIAYITWFKAGYKFVSIRYIYKN